MAPTRKFKDEWFEIEDYRQWLERVQGDHTKASCSTCHKEFNAEITTIKRHKATHNHIAGQARLQQSQVLQAERQQVQHAHAPPPNAVTVATILMSGSSPEQPPIKQEDGGSSSGEALQGEGGLSSSEAFQEGAGLSWSEAFQGDCGLSSREESDEDLEKPTITYEEIDPTPDLGDAKEGAPIAVTPTVVVPPKTAAVTDGGRDPDDDALEDVLSTSTAEMADRVVPAEGHGDEFYHFGMYVASQLRGMPPRAAVEVQLEIQRALTVKRLQCLQ